MPIVIELVVNLVIVFFSLFALTKVLDFNLTAPKIAFISPVSVGTLLFIPGFGWLVSLTLSYVFLKTLSKEENGPTIIMYFASVLLSGTLMYGFYSLLINA